MRMCVTKVVKVYDKSELKPEEVEIKPKIVLK